MGRNRLRKKMTIAEKEVGSITLPVYYLGKPAVTPKKSRVKLILIGVLALLILIIYLPPLVFSAPDATKTASPITMKPNDAAMEEAISLFRNAPNEDFDGDGLINELENKYGTNAFVPDYDKDGVSDYAELFITNTNPAKYESAAENYIRNLGIAANDPFKVNDVILWADDYKSHANGSVIESSPNIFRFSGFIGWAQFPRSGFAYAIKDGAHSLLEQHSNGSYRIEANESDLLVFLSDTKLTEHNRLSLLGKDILMESSWYSDVLSFVLPSNGFGLITCKKITSADLQTATSIVLENDRVQCDVKSLPKERFGKNNVALTDLQNILEKLKDGENVLISLMDHTKGEIILEIYGYTSEFDLLVCDAATGEKVGTLDITISSARILDKTGEIQVYNYFDFAGQGYNSLQKHRLSILGTIPAKEEPPTEPEPSETEPVTEDPTEKITEDPIALQEAYISDLISQIIHPGFGEEAEYFEGPGRYQITINAVSSEQISTFTKTIRTTLGFGKYYEVKVTVPTKLVILADEMGNIVTIKYGSEVQSVVIRFERFDSEQTIELKPEYYIDEAGQEAYIASLVAQIIHPGIGEEGQYFEGPGRYQITIGAITPEQMSAFIETVQTALQFNKYYEHTSTPPTEYTILVDKMGNIVTTKYHSENQSVVIRFEQFDSEQTVELKLENYVSG